MFGPFLGSAFGGLLKFAALPAGLLGLFGLVMGGPAAGVWLMGAVGLYVLGAYLQFRADHSVRVVNLPSTGPREPMRPRRMSDALLNPDPQGPTTN